MRLNIGFDWDVNFTLDGVKDLIKRGIPVVVSIDIVFFGGDEHQNHTVVVTEAAMIL